MRPTTFSLLAVLAATVLVGGAVAQGRGGGQGGPGRGMGGGARMGAGIGRGACMGMGAGMGRGACRMGGGMAQGGWWTRVSGETPEQQAVLQKLNEMHADIRMAQQELMTLRLQNAPAQDIGAKQTEIAGLQSDLHKYQLENRAALQTLAGPAVRGRATGARAGARGVGVGPRAGIGCPGCPNPGANCAACPYYGVSCAGCPGCPGGGQGRGSGAGPRNGTGPNPNCPLKQ